MDAARESREMYGSTSSDEQGSVTTVIHVDRGMPAEQQRRQQTGSGVDGGKRYPEGRRLSLRDRADDTSDSDDGRLMPPADRTAANDSDSDSTLSDTQEWGSRQSAGKPAVPPKPQSFPSSVALPTRRNVSLRVSLASEGSNAVETVIVSDPTIRNGSCVPSPSEAPIDMLPPLSATITQGICPVDQTWTGVQVGSGLFQTISSLYALLLIVVGLVLSIAEVSKPQPVLLFDVFEWFFVYLFGMSIVFLLYVCLVVMRRPSTQDALMGRNDNVPIEGSLLRRWSRRHSTETHAASFYLRLGAVGFGIGAMIHEGLAFGQLFEDGIMSPCLDITEVIRSVLQLTFTFVQLYTIVLSSTACLHKHTPSAYFAYMHMAATNACVWLRVVIMETTRDVANEHDSVAIATHASTSPVPVFVATVAPPPGNYTHDPDVVQELLAESGVLCPRIDLMGHVVRAASPYLYPCTVQYSLVAGGILCVTWYGMSRCPSSQQTPASDDGTKVSMKVDCRGNHYGLFCGLFALVATIIAVIVFFVFLGNAELVATASLMLYTLQGALCALAIVALVFAAVLMSKMTSDATGAVILDELLLMLSVCGIYVLCGFSIVAGLYHAESYPGLFLFLSCGVVVLQATIQTVFIRCSLRRSQRHRSDKPGHECITFLIVINVALWGVALFERLRNDVAPTARDFYGAPLWSVIAHIAEPFSLFYRFHSAVCLANIWGSAYKVVR